MSTLVLNLGNSSLFGGEFTGEKLVTSFRAPIKEVNTAPGFARNVVRRVQGNIDCVAICSVVPQLTKKIAAHVRREFGIAPRLLTAKASHGLKIGYPNPAQLGTDRLAAALGARKLFPAKNIIVVDCGTATTVTALRRDGVLLGGAIFPGFALWPEMLASRTAQLPRVSLRRPPRALGRSTEAGLESGIFYGHVGAIRELVRRIRTDAFGRSDVIVLGTGGHGAHFARAKIFDQVVPELVLIGLNEFLQREKTR